MSVQKPSLPKGTRDFGPLQMARRNFILDTIKDTFKLFGFQQLETPAMENLSTLTGKYGDEGDKLLFKVLDSGEYFEKTKTKINADSISLLREYLLDLFKDTYLQFENNIDLNKFVLNYLDKFKDKCLVYNNAAYLSDSTIEFLHNFIKRHKKRISRLIQKELEEIQFWKITNQEEYPKNYIEREINKIITFLINRPEFRYLESGPLFNETSKNLTKYISEKGLRYDLTVPFARYVVMNRNDITFPFKRFQIQPVWRADRPQRGRYREFYQCDADVVGTDSLVCELEILLMIKRVFSKLGITDYSIKINNRKILTGLSEVIGEKGREGELCVAIDKLDKIGWEKVQDELLQRNFEQTAIEKLEPVIHLKQSNQEKLEFLKGFLSASEIGLKGLQELEEVFDLLQTYGENEEHVDFDVVLARGLTYYTGAIFEVKVNNVSIGSVSGGGRYDDLTGVFGLDGVSGVGFSFGVDRLYDVMDELGIFPEENFDRTKVLITHFDEKGFKYGLKVLNKLRTNGVTSELFPEITKIKKQFSYADKKGIPYVIVLGDDEINKGMISLKNLATGQQDSMHLEEAIDKIV